MQIAGTALTGLNGYAVNWPAFNGGFDVVSPAAVFTVSNAVGGTGSLGKFGAGTLCLTASNTYSGGTTILGGTLEIGNGGTSGSIAGNVTDNAALAFNRSDDFSPACIVTGSGQLVQAGPGTMTLGGAVSNPVVAAAGRIVVAPTGMLTGNLTVAAGARVENDASALQIGSFTNAGTFLGSADPGGSFVNQSSGDVRIAGGQRVYLQGALTQTNSGLIEVLGGQAAQAQFESAGPLLNAAGGHSLITAQNAALYFDGGATNQGSVSFTSGASSVFGSVTNAPGGTIAVVGGAGVTFYGNVVQNGTLNVGAVGGTYSSAVFCGALSGSGGITGGGDIFLLGDLRPAMTAMTINGNVYMTQSTDSVLQLAGTAAGSQFSQVNVTGAVVLNGALCVTLSNSGYRPANGAQFQVMTFGSYTDGFCSTSGLDLGGRLELVPTLASNSLTLTAVQGGSGTWNVDANGLISAAGDWAAGLPGEAGDNATFGPVISAPRTVTVDVPTTLGEMTFDSGKSYTVAGSNSITLEMPEGPAQITVLAGSHTISAPWYWRGIWR